MRPPRRDAVGHHALVKLAQVEPAAARRLIVAAQLERRHLAEKISAVGGIVGAAHGFLTRRGRRKMRLALEQLRRLIDRPAAAMKSEARDQPADPGHSFTRLRDTVARIIAL